MRRRKKKPLPCMGTGLVLFNPTALRAELRSMSLESLESFRPLIAAVLTTFGLIVLNRLLPVFDHMTDHRSTAVGVAYDVCLAVFIAFTLTSFFTGLGYV
jgi:hypothetical protein